MAAKKDTKKPMCANQTKIHAAAVKFLTEQFSGEDTTEHEPEVKAQLIRSAYELIFLSGH